MKVMSCLPEYTLQIGL